MKQNKTVADSGKKRHTYNKVPSSSLLPSLKVDRSSGIPISIPMASYPPPQDWLNAIIEPTTLISKDVLIPQNDPRSGRIVRSDQVRMNQTSNLTNVRQESRVARMKSKELSSQTVPDNFLRESKCIPQSKGPERRGRGTSPLTSSSSTGHKVFDLTGGEGSIDSRRKRQKTRVSHGRRPSTERLNLGVVLEDSDEEVKLVRGAVNPISGRRGFWIMSSPEKEDGERATASSSSPHSNDNIINKATAVISKCFSPTNTRGSSGFRLRTSNMAKRKPDPFELPEDDGDADELRLVKQPGTTVREGKTKSIAAAAAAFKEIDAFTDAILAEKSKTRNEPQGQNRKTTTSARSNMSLSKQKSQHPVSGASSSTRTRSATKGKPGQSPVPIAVPIAVPTRFSTRLSSKVDKEAPICIDLDDEESSQLEKHNEPICSYPSQGIGAIRIFKSDVERLEGNEFLNDTLIEFYLRWLLDHSSNGHEIYVFNSFFYERLSNSTRNDPYEAVRRWAAKADIFEKRFIFIPVNENFHWFLIVVANPGSCIQDTPCDDPRIFILDSLGVKRTRVGKTIQKYLKSAAQDRHNIDGSNFRLPRIYHANVPIQSNAFDCGVYLLHFAQTCMANPDHFQQLLLANRLDDNAWQTSAVQGLRSTIAETIHGIENQ